MSAAYHTEHMPSAPSARELTAEDKLRGMASVFKRDDEKALRREKVSKKEKDVNYIPDSYAECYPGYV